MMELNLVRINLVAPYYVEEENGILSFNTDYDIDYGVTFEEDSSMMQYQTYIFGINNRSHKPSPNDPKLRQTVIAIIDEFFTSNKEVLLYICETGDDMQESRFRLFLRWFNTYEKHSQFTIRMLEGIMDGKIPNYGAIIVENNHPEYDLIMQRFDETEAFLKKPR